MIVLWLLNIKKNTPASKVFREVKIFPFTKLKNYQILKTSPDKRPTDAAGGGRLPYPDLSAKLDFCSNFPINYREYLKSNIKKHHNSAVKF